MHVERPEPIKRVPMKLEERLGADVVAELISAYRAGASTRAIASRYDLSISSVMRLLRRHREEVRPRGRYRP